MAKKFHLQLKTEGKIILIFLCSCFGM